MNLQLWPMSNQNPDYEGNPTDAILSMVWKQMENEGKTKTVFYDGAVQTPGQWLAYIKDPTVAPVFIVNLDTKSICFAAWLNQFRDGVAQGHFCGLGKWNPDFGRLVINYWRAFKGPDQSAAIKVVWGVVPATNEKAIAAAESCGLKMGGEIPKLCHLVYEARRVPGKILYVDLEGTN